MVTGKRRLPGSFAPLSPNWSHIRLAPWTISNRPMTTDIYLELPDGAAVGTPPDQMAALVGRLDAPGSP